MQKGNKIGTYCFNKACVNSVYNPGSEVREFPVEVILSRTISCAACGNELLSPIQVDIKLDIFNLLLNSNRRNYITVLDDDIIFLETVKSILGRHNLLTANYYQDGKAVLEDLELQFHEKTGHPALIFLDINMPVMDGWQFLEQFKVINRKLERPISVYIISNSMDPLDSARSKLYPFVKSIISKPLTRHFLEKISEELVKFG